MNWTALEPSEYWLLESSVDAWVPLHLLVRPNVNEVFNKCSHGLDRSQLLGVLLTLFDKNLIVGKTWHKESSFRPTEAQVNAALNIEGAGDAEGGILYGLTPLGGRVWEEYAKPDWDRFISHGWDATSKVFQEGGESKEVEEEEICAARREWVEIFSLVAGLMGHRILPGSVVWEELRPWHATYWKTLPVGYRIRYQFVARDAGGSWAEVMALYAKLKNWFSPPNWSVIVRA